MTNAIVTREIIAASVATAFQSAPVTVTELTEAATRAGAPPAVIDVVATLPPERHYFQLRDLWKYLPDVPLSESANSTQA